MRAAALCSVLLLSGCVVGANFIKKDKDTGLKLPVLIGAAAADFLVASLASSQLESFSVGAALATGAAVTALDLGVGCVLGACQNVVR